MRLHINGAVPHLCRWGIGPDEVVAPPVRRRSNWSWREPATAVRADVLQHLFDARPTECALEAAYHRIASLGRQRLVAVLAGRSKFKGHCCLLMHEAVAPGNRSSAVPQSDRRCPVFRGVFAGLVFATAMCAVGVIHTLLAVPTPPPEMIISYLP